MDEWKRQIPEGVQDFLMQECYHKRQIESSIRKIFYSWGYDEIETPTFEYYDVFASGIGSIRQEQMFKFFDHRGRILVLRPDITMPIARVAATKLKEMPLPLRLCYISNAFGYDFSHSGQQREFTQAGIELLGIKGPEADAEVILLAISVLKAIGLENFQIDIGQVDFFKGLMEEAGLHEEEAEELREYIDQKNMLSVELFLKDLNLSDRIKPIIMSLPALYGGPDILEEAARLTHNERCRKAIDNIRQVYNILVDFGLENYISIDFGMVQNIDYYSGIIFRGITDQLGFPILTGGRYDELVKKFGYDLPATGFALGIKRILMVLEKQGKLGDVPGIDMLVGFHPGIRKYAFEYIENQRKTGKRIEVFLGNGEEELKQYAQKKNIEKAVFLGSIPSITELNGNGEGNG